jgi:hypothetical protein
VLVIAYDDTKNIFLITKTNGIVETRDINGNHLRMICDGVIEAKFSGTDILTVEKMVEMNFVIDLVIN